MRLRVCWGSIFQLGGNAVLKPQSKARRAVGTEEVGQPVCVGCDTCAPLDGLTSTFWCNRIAHLASSYP